MIPSSYKETILRKSAKVEKHLGKLHWRILCHNNALADSSSNKDSFIGILQGNYQANAL